MSFSASCPLPLDAVRADPEAHLRWMIDTHLHLTEALLPWFTFAFMEGEELSPGRAPHTPLTPRR